MNCPYCGKEAAFISSKQFYGRGYGTNLYVCRPCDARVGTHGKGKTPLGTMANVNLRALRKACHRHFDQLWKSKSMSRSKAYVWLAEVMNLPKEKAHIAMFDEEQCLSLLKHLTKRRRLMNDELKRYGS